MIQDYTWNIAVCHLSSEKSFEYYIDFKPGKIPN